MNLEHKELIEKFLELYPDSKMKKCKNCKTSFPLSSHFYSKEKRIHDGFENTCKVCKGKTFIQIKNKNINFQLNTESNDKIIIDYENYVLSNVRPSQQFMNDNFVKIITYLIEEKYKMTDEQIVLITREWIKDHKLYAVSIHKFNGSTIDMIDYVYPHRFKPWQFITSGCGYWEDDDNIRGALNWMVNKMLEDGTINSVSEIPYKVDGSVFAKYQLKGLLDIRFKGHAYYAMNYLYPESFYIWEYNVITDNYWESKENRCAALRQLVENRIKLNVKDIPRLLSYTYFVLTKYQKFKTVLDMYYNYDIYEYVNDCYPNVFKRRDFPSKNHYVTLDNTYVRSEPERMINHLFMNSNVSFQYEPIEHRFIDDEYEKQYRPDWVMKHDDRSIIVEYYGMLDMKNLDYGYDEKYLKKHAYYNQLCANDDRYMYIELITADIKNGLKGVKDKFHHIGITLESSYY